MDYPSRTHKRLLDTLSSFIGHTDWFIAGSFATPQVTTPSDIDVYFYTEVDYDNAVRRLRAFEAATPKKIDLKSIYACTNQLSTTHITNNAVTFTHPDINLPVQLICRNVGTVKEILDGFDLNVCKHAILPDGTICSDKEASLPLKICNINAHTFKRIIKYTSYLGVQDVSGIFMSLIDKYVADSSMLEDYYSDDGSTVPVNETLHNAINTLPRGKYADVVQYLSEQTEKYAPELLI